MFKHYFEQVHNVALWPIISLSIFFLFFVGLLIWVLRVNKDYISEMKALPLEGNLKRNKNTLDHEPAK